MALLLYSYIAGVAIISLTFGFLLLEWGISKIDARMVLKITKRHRLIFSGVFFVGILPLVLFYIGHRNQGASARMGEASFLNPVINHGDPWGALWHGISGNFAAFGLQPVQWLAAGQISQFWMAPLPLLAFAGIVITLLRIKQAPYRFLLLWWGLTIVPAALAPDRVPHSSRAVGVFAPLAILTALPVNEVFKWLIIMPLRRWRAAAIKNLMWILLGGGVLGWIIFLSGTQLWQQYRYYFNDWAHTPAALAGFDDYAPRLVADMASLAEPDAAFILLRNTAAGSVSPNGSVNFFYRLTHSAAPHYWVSNDETTLPQKLTAIAQNKKRLFVVDWKITKHNQADPKQVFDYYLQKYGAETARHNFGEYVITTYDLPAPNVDFSARETLLPAQISFGGQISLTGYAFGGQRENDTAAKAGKTVWARLRWQKTADHPEPLKVSLILKDAVGNKITAVDKYLQNNIFQRYSTEWTTGETADTYFILPLPADLLPGEYTLAILVYGADSLAPLRTVPDNRLQYPLGELRVLPAEKVAPFAAGQSLALAGALDSGLSLYVNSQQLPTDVRPGNQILLDTVWHTDAPLPDDYTIEWTLQPAHGRFSLGKWLVGGRDYPTGAWRTGETLRQRFNIPIPPGANGSAQLTANILRADHTVARWTVAVWQIKDWRHTFLLPPDATPVNARFGQSLVFAGYNLAVSPQTNALQLTVYWKTDTVLLQEYTMFVHLINADNQLVGQVDRVPTGGEKPMLGWLPGEIISDTVTLSFPPDTDLRILQLSIGLYSPEDFRRLPVVSGSAPDDKILLPVR